MACAWLPGSRVRKPNVPSPYCPSLFSSPAARCRFNCTGSESHHAIDALKARIAAGTLVLPLGPPVDAVEAELVHAPTDGRHLCHAGRGVKAYGASEIGRRPLCRVDWTVVHGYPLHLCKNTTDRIETLPTRLGLAPTRSHPGWPQAHTIGRIP